MKYKTRKPYLIINSCPREVRLRVLHRDHLAVGSTLEFTDENDYNILRLEVDKPTSTEIEIRETMKLGNGLGYWSLPVRTTLTCVYTICNLIKRQLTLAVHMLMTGLWL